MPILLALPSNPITTVMAAKKKTIREEKSNAKLKEMNFLSVKEKKLIAKNKTVIHSKVYGSSILPRKKKHDELGMVKTNNYYV